MRAIILTAGVGSRLGEMTREIPKPMIEIRGEPILKRTVIWLKENGITDIFMNLHHAPHVITDFFGDGSKFGVSISYSQEEELLGTSGGVKKIIQENTIDTKEPLLVFYGDNIYPEAYSLEKFLAFHQEQGAPISIGLCRHEGDVSHKGVVVLKDSYISEFIEKPLYKPDSDLINIALYILNPSVANMIPEGYSDFGKDLFPEMLRGGIPLAGYIFDKPVGVIDTPELYELERTRT
ncbi:MAG: nucleotidyltransferase family protein [bacterium]|nr:nucleotidyltransferase family protein [bacterium]